MNYLWLMISTKSDEYFSDCSFSAHILSEKLMKNLQFLFMNHKTLRVEPTSSNYATSAPCHEITLNTKQFSFEPQFNYWRTSRYKIWKHWKVFKDINKGARAAGQCSWFYVLAKTGSLSTPAILLMYGLINKIFEIYIKLTGNFIIILSCWCLSLY